MNFTYFAMPFVAFALAGCTGDKPDADVNYKTQDPVNANAPVEPSMSSPVDGLHDGTSSDGNNPNNSVGR